MANRHFFQPLLPGFHTHLTIPVAFFSKHIEGRNGHNNTAKLRSDASEMTWKVKIEDDGRRLTEGWKEFAHAHDLRVGDIVIFRQEKDMAFHVTLFGPSCCEIQYGSCIDQDNNLEKIPKKKNPNREEAESSEANEIESLSTEPESNEESNHISSQERIERKDKKGGTIRKASSSTTQSRFVTLTIKPSDFKNSRLVSFIKSKTFVFLQSLSRY
ncbi:B3 domain-containing protein REM14 [Raphanus sativus]|uniref:B3 domain-containing protein REM14 n=1 Tax=Raphanus sativus TaxID=3726 RepID=A0A6J0NKR0_RAPSA|nr:B3 domain-containing protein REM14 [Raphanus sativus]